MSLSPLLALRGERLSDQMDRSQARSMVITKLGIVAASQSLASQAGAQILARGGSAADAAIAANAVLGVVEPMMDGMGGDLFAIEWDAKTGKLAGLNSSGWAPEKLTPELLKQKGFTHMPGQGIFSVTVPGCVRGWKRCTRNSASCPGRTCSNRPSIMRRTASPSPRSSKLTGARKKRRWKRT